MGGRGARFGVSEKGRKYGTEYKTVLQAGRIKFVKQIDDRPQGKKKLKPQSVTAPMDTRTKGRIYVTVNEHDQLTFITFYKQGKRKAQIDLTKPHNDLGVPHIHKGYIHDENGTRKSNLQEKRLVEKVQNLWHNRHQE